MLYNDTINYSALRETVSEAVFGKQIEKLVEATKVLAYMLDHITFDLGLLGLYHY